MAHKVGTKATFGGDIEVAGAATITGASTLSGAITASLPVTLPTYAVAGVPAASSYTGAIIYCSNGAAGNPCLAISDGTNWLRCDTLAAVAAA